MSYIPPYYKGMGTRYQTKKNRAAAREKIEVAIPEVAVLAVGSPLNENPVPEVEVQEPVEEAKEVQEPEVQEPVEEAKEVQEPEVQEPEEEAKEVQEPEVQEPEVQEPVEEAKEIQEEDNRTVDNQASDSVIGKILAKEEITNEEKESFIAHLNLDETSKSIIAGIGEKMGITLNKKKMNKTQMVEFIKSRL